MTTTENISPYRIDRPHQITSPVLVSIPHSGIEFPEEIKNDFFPKFQNFPEDTDWYLHNLYDFCTEIGITVISAPFSRYVIDLNRSLQATHLYEDQRFETSLTPIKSFKKENLYSTAPPNKKEIERRITHYYQPYYSKVASILDDLKKEYGHALLFDAHSIKRKVPAIQAQEFPDMVLGDNDQLSAHQEIIKVALEQLQQSEYCITHNTPFKGGNITRSFGDPKKNIHAIQLEMSKDIYMDTGTHIYTPDFKPHIKPFLRNLLKKLSLTVKNLESL